jgi:hypothetical protein
VAAGVAYLVTTLAPFVFPIWREMDRRPSGVAVEVANPEPSPERA